MPAIRDTASDEPGGPPDVRGLSHLLAPLEAAYRVVVCLRSAGYDRGWLPVLDASIPVISVGNLTVGGTGKTPFVRWLATRLVADGCRPGIIHGGYGDDEPALHRRWHPDLPVIVRRDRHMAVREAARAGANVALLDDGFQHRRLARDLDIVLVSADAWTTERRLLPRGPWREPLTAASRADIVIVTRKAVSEQAARAVADVIRETVPGPPVVLCAMRPSGWSSTGGAPRHGRPAGVAVAGLAAPGPFFANARAAGAVIEERLVYSDHHPYGAGDVAHIADRAGDRAIITTEKDAIKLERAERELDLWVLGQEVRIEDGAATVERLIREARA